MRDQLNYRNQRQKNNTGGRGRRLGNQGYQADEQGGSSFDEGDNREWDENSYNYSDAKNRDYGYQQDLTSTGQRRSQDWSASNAENYARTDMPRRYSGEDRMTQGNYGANDRGSAYSRDSFGSTYGRDPYTSNRMNTNSNFEYQDRNSNQGYNQNYRLEDEGGFGQADRYDQTYARSYPQSYSQDSLRNFSPQGSNDYQGRGYSQEEQPRFNTGSTYQTWNRPTTGRSWEGNTQQPPYQQNQQSYSGKGPKGYKRSDESVKEEISLMLTRHHEVDATDVEIEVSDGEATLAGSVPERRMKHLTEDLVEKVMGVKDVVNNIRVKKQSESGMSAAGMEKDTDSDKTGSKSKKTTTPH